MVITMVKIWKRVDTHPFSHSYALHSSLAIATKNAIAPPCGDN